MNDTQLVHDILDKAKELGFIDGKIAPCILPSQDIDQIEAWLAKGYYGQMHYLSRHGASRADAQYVLSEAKSIILLALPYWSESFAQTARVLKDSEKAYISRYALGRDYHKVIRNKLKTLGEFICEKSANATYRGVVDSAPLAEVAFSALAGLGWRGKNSLLLQKNSGSLFFLGALITNLSLPFDQPIREHCGSCNRCIKACPTEAIISPYVVDARRCLSYLTIENPDLIPEPFRKAMSNRIYGCDDCQIVCPFNRFLISNQQADFEPRQNLNNASLLNLLDWTEENFKHNMAGSPIYRIGYIKWLSNIIIALGNAPKNDRIIASLQTYLNHPNTMLQEAARWSIGQHNG